MFASIDEMVIEQSNWHGYLTKPLGTSGKDATTVLKYWVGQ